MQGTFVLQANALPPLIPLSTVAGPAADVEDTKIVSRLRLHPDRPVHWCYILVDLAVCSLLLVQYLAYPAAMIQGALAKLGLNATVTAESSGLPQCKSSSLFQLVAGLSYADPYISIRVNRYFPDQDVEGPTRRVGVFHVDRKSGYSWGWGYQIGSRISGLTEQ